MKIWSEREEQFKNINKSECERCWSHEQVEDTLIFQNSEGKWFLRTDFDVDEVNGFYEYSYAEIKYCPYCGRRL